MKKIIVMLIAVTACVVSIIGQTSKSIPRADVPAVCDGIISEEEWNKALVFSEFFQITPGDNAAPSEKTVMYMMYDDSAVYVAAKCFVEDASTIQDFQCQRDTLAGTDRVFLYFDTFNAKNKAFYFGSNINGQQADGIIDGRATDSSVNMRFFTATKRTDYGFDIEFTIPLKSFAFKSGENVQWGIFMKRIIAGKDEEAAMMPVNRSSVNYFNNYGSVVFEKLPSQQNLNVLVSLITTHHDAEDPVSDFRDKETSAEPEATITYEPFSGAALTLTVNPDFSTVEADSLTVTVNSRYPVLYPEKRPFFLEKNTPFSAPITIFHSRQIVNPVWGSKVSLLKDKWSYFALVAKDQNAPADRFYSEMTGEEDATFAFTHLRYNISDNGSFVRAAAALRSFRDFDNYIGSIDAIITLNANTEVKSQYVHSIQELPSLVNEEGDAYFINMRYSSERVYGEVTAEFFSPYFRDDLGYITETDTREYSGYFEYHRSARLDTEPIRYFETNIRGNLQYTYDGSRQTGWEYEQAGGLTLSNDIGYWTGREECMELFADREFVTQYWWGSLNVWTSDLIGGNAEFTTGKGLWYDETQPFVADYWRHMAYVDAKVCSWAQISFKGQYQRLEDAYSAETYEIRSKIQFNSSILFRTIIQLSDIYIVPHARTVRRVDVYPLFVYQPNVHFSIYAGMTYAEDDRRENVPLRERTAQDWFVKLSMSTDIL